MWSYSRKCIAVAMLIVASDSTHGQHALEEPARKPPTLFTDTDGNEHRIPCAKDKRAIVLIFITTECPIANSYHPKLRRLREEFADSQFDFAMVHAESDLGQEAARNHQREFDIDWPIALDPGSRLARQVGAKVTPEAIVLNSTGEVLYRGRIDDRYQEYGRKRPEPTTNDLQIALKAIAEGKPVPVRETKPIGCIIRHRD